MRALIFVFLLSPLTVAYGHMLGPDSNPKDSKSGSLLHDAGLFRSKDEMPSIFEILGERERKGTRYYAKCTAFFVSDQGDAMTAAHCLDHCRKTKICEIWFGGKRFNINIKASSLNAKCSVYEIITARRKKNADSLNNNSYANSNKCANKSSSDLALFRFEKTPKDFKCLPIADQKAQANQMFVSAGYPTHSTRPGRDDNSSGKGLHFSDYGVVYENSKNICHNLNGSYAFISEYIQKSSAFPERPFAETHYQSTVDMVGGSSGGPLIDPVSGKVYGVSSFRAHEEHNENKECKGATFFQRLDNYPGRLKALNPNLRISSLTCDKKKEDLSALKINLTRSLSRVPGTR